MKTRATDASMKIHVNSIPEEGVQQHERYDPSAMDMDREDVHPQSPFEVDVFVARSDRELIVKADIQCPLRCTCARCLEDFTDRVETGAVFTYRVQPTDVVDITDDVRQEVILAYPMVPVCKPDCKGLCAACGQNLNLAACAHALQS